MNKPHALKSADILSKVLAGHSEAMLVEEGYSLTEVRAALQEQVRQIVAAYDRLTPETAYAEWLLGKQPIIHAMLKVVREGNDREKVQAAVLLDRMQDSRLDKARELGIVRPSTESKETIQLSDTELAAQAKQMLADLEGLDNRNIIDLAPRRLTRTS